MNTADTPGSERPPFKRVGIAGLGLIGGSVALATRRAWPSVSLTACVRRENPRVREVVDDVVGRVGDLASCDLIVMAMPIDRVPEYLVDLARSGTRALVTDVSSAKRRVMAAAVTAGLTSFIGGHPMAGGERPGLEFARADLFQSRPWLLVPGSGDVGSCAALERFVTGLGAVAQWMNAERHDRTVAYVSHLPQIVAAALMNAADAAVGAAGSTVAGNAFGEMTRLASSPSDMWTAVLAENADFVAEALATFLSELPVDASIASGDWAHDALARSGEARAHWRRSRPGGE